MAMSCALHDNLLREVLWGQGGSAAVGAIRGRAGGAKESFGVISVKMSASDIDVHVGTQMRKRREALGISQGRLGRHLGLTFSQIQKYEKGTNRVGAGRLYQIASFLGVTPGHFFIGIDGSDEATVVQREDSRLDEIRTLNDAFASIKDGETRASVLALVRSLAGDASRRRSG